MDISVEVRTIVNDARKRVETCKTAQELSDILLQFFNLLDKEKKMENESFPKEKADLNEASLSTCDISYSPEFKKEFIFRHYSNFCEHILIHGDVGLLKDVKSILTRLFTKGPAELSLLALVSSIQSVSQTDKLYLIVSLLDDFVSKGKFTEIFISLCLADTPKGLMKELLIVVTTLPDQLANKMKLSLSGKFHPNSYFAMLGKEIIQTLIKLHGITCKSVEYSILFLSNLIGKIALRGSTAALFAVLLPQLKEWCYTSPLWSNLCSMLITQIPQNALEPVIEYFLTSITFYPFFSKVLKDTVLTNAVIKHLITHKFLLVRFYNNPHVLPNIVGHLSADSRRAILVNVLKMLLQHWSDQNTIKRCPYEQHFYVTEAVILATIQLNETEISENKNYLLSKMLSGVQAHLENPNNKIRQIGMVLAECMTARLHPNTEKLQFEIVSDHDIEKLRALSLSPKFGPDYEKQNFSKKANVIDNSVGNHDLQNASNCSDHKKPLLDDNNDDDDDDLEPFEMSEDDNELIVGIQPPRYISQCIDGLLASDDPKRHIASLRVLTKVVNSDSDNLHHHCVQLVTILLHLQDKYSLEDYNELRFEAMVDIAVKCPVKVSDYLTNEFYAQNYSLRQRMDILDVLAMAAMELSKPDSTNESPKSLIDNVMVSTSNENETKHWKRVVQERIDKKTRRFSKKFSVIPPKGSINKFANVAGHFFFPLLQGLSNRPNTFDLLGEECMVLGSLLYSLGNIMYCARGILIAQSMAKSLIGFVWVLRYHNEAYVRQGVLFSLAMVVISVPGFFLMTEVQNELAECQSWLEHVLHSDPSAQCRESALQVLVLIRDIFQKQFHFASEYCE